ncbi:PaaI family thioesterase [Desulforamulus ruminis]|uniref:Thioesterase superfamily protein n=1 Tax=Desulforamulus ruminis (strain ATCC 23193 / DSM 2154 / NCIMB 8452 / DL) TaxID=696281 RepID=F6DRZ6_DESRL|nr:hotdog fold thioesterase [Desulforamulus ruminis]AEG61020.1 thioesterase superfamily protein [Desulforamulus ruminis DSM 2154]
MDQMKDFMNHFQEKDELANYLGINLVEVRPGYARGVMRVKKELLNGLGVTHGGSLFSLADVVFAAASNSTGVPALSLNVYISFLKASVEGEVLTAVALEENTTRKTGLYRMEIRNEQNELVATAQGQVYRLSNPRPLTKL